MGIGMIFVITFTFLSLGGGIGYILWLKTRPKKLVWNAKCYQLSEGTKKRQIAVIKHGKKILINGKMHDIIPYVEDILERTEREHGIISYKLQKQDISTNAVTADMVEVWGKDKKEVCVLVHGGTATVMKKGYDKDAGEMIFNPVPRDRIEHIKSEIAIKKERFKDKQSILATITPWIVAGVLMVGMVTAAYFHADGIVAAEDIRKASQKETDNANIIISENFKESARIIRGEVDEAILGLQEPKEQPPPPSIN